MPRPTTHDEKSYAQLQKNQRMMHPTNIREPTSYDYATKSRPMRNSPHTTLDKESHALLAEIQGMGRPTNIHDAQTLNMLKERLKLIDSLREPTDGEDYDRLRSRAPF